MSDTNVKESATPDPLPPSINVHATVPMPAPKGAEIPAAAPTEPKTGEDGEPKKPLSEAAKAQLGKDLMGAYCWIFGTFSPETMEARKADKNWYREGERLWAGIAERAGITDTELLFWLQVVIVLGLPAWECYKNRPTPKPGEELEKKPKPPPRGGFKKEEKSYEAGKPSGTSPQPVEGDQGAHKKEGDRRRKKKGGRPRRASR